MSGFLYAIECGGRIKLGFSMKPHLRLNKVASDAPFPCVMLGYWPGTISDEDALHARFAELRRHGEWFQSDPAIVAYVKDHAVSAISRPRFEVRADDSPLAVWRKTNGLSQFDVGQKVGLSACQISRVEGGRSRLSLRAAVELHKMSGGQIPMDSFIGCRAMSLVPLPDNGVVNRALDAGKRHLDGKQGFLHVVAVHDDSGDYLPLQCVVEQTSMSDAERESQDSATKVFDVHDSSNESIRHRNRFDNGCILEHDLPAPSAEAQDGRSSMQSANESSDNCRSMSTYGYAILTPPDVPPHLRVGRLPCNTPEAPADLFSPWTVRPAQPWRAVGS